MAIGDHFIHRCTIERDTETALSAYGNAAEAWVTVQADAPCRLVEKDERVRTDEIAESLVRTKYLLLMGAGTDLRERDRVTIGARVFSISAVMSRNARGPHHVSARLEIVE